MMRVLNILVFAAWASVSLAQTEDEKLSLGEISAYLNDLRTAQGAFTQFNDDGSISTGTLFIKRPGRMRIEYNPPESALLIAGSGAVVIYDPKSNTPPQTYPLRRTPLSIILADDVDLGQAQMVTGHKFDGTATIVTAQDPEHPEYGSIELAFTDAPVELREWVIDDGAGGRTRVVLSQMQADIELPNRLFDTGSPGRPPPSR